jgi:hypothetical protein
MIGLLAITAIPTVTGVGQAISQRDKKHAPKSSAHEERQMKRFHMWAWCEGKSPGKSEVHQGVVVAGGGRVSESSSPKFLIMIHAIERLQL